MNNPSRIITTGASKAMEATYYVRNEELIKRPYLREA